MLGGERQVHGQGDVPDRRAARQRATRSRSAASRSARSPSIELDRQRPGRGRDGGGLGLRAAARGHARRRPGRLAVGDRGPLRLAHPGPERRRARSRTAGRSTPTTPPRRSTSTSSSTRSTRRRARASRRSSRAARPSTTARPRRRTRRPSTSTRRSRPASRLTRELIRDDERVRAASSSTRPRSSGAIAERRDDLADLVSNANATARAIGDENVALARALGLLPPTLRKANTTFVNLRAALGDLDVLVAESKPATKDLAPFFRALRPLVARRRADDPRPALPDQEERPGQRPDRPDAEAAAARASCASVAFPRSIKALQKSQPVIEYIRPYTPDLAGWLTKFGQGASNYDAHGHFARIQPMFNPFSITSAPLLGAGPHADAERDAPAGPRDDPVASAARAARRSRRPTARRRGATPTAASTATPTRCHRAHEADLRHSDRDRRAPWRRSCSASARPTTTARATRSARSSTTSRAPSRART